MFKFLRSISVLIDILATFISESKRKKKQAERQAEHDQIESDATANLAKRGWLQSITREDGSPRDYDVSGPSGTLNSGDAERVPSKRIGYDQDA